MRRGGGLFRLGDDIPEGYFTEAEIADLEARGKITVERPEPERLPELDEPPEPELEQTREIEHEQLPELDEPPEHEPEIDLGGAVELAKKRRRRKS